MLPRYLLLATATCPIVSPAMAGDIVNAQALNDRMITGRLRDSF